MHDQILLIDDDPVINFLHRRMVQLSYPDSPVKVFEDGLQAMNYVKANVQNSFLVFLDINMPVMNGWEFLNTLDSEGIDLRGEVIILTSSVENEDRQKAMNFDLVRGFISKPLTRHHLEEIEG